MLKLLSERDRKVHIAGKQWESTYSGSKVRDVHRSNVYKPGYQENGKYTYQEETKNQHIPDVYDTTIDVPEKKESTHTKKEVGEYTLSNKCYYVVGRRGRNIYKNLKRNLDVLQVVFVVLYGIYGTKHIDMYSFQHINIYI